MFSFTLESENWNLLKLDLEALRFLFALVLEQWNTFCLQEVLSTGAKIVAIVVIFFSALCFQACTEQAQRH